MLPSRPLCPARHAWLARCRDLSMWDSQPHAAVRDLAAVAIRSRSVARSGRAAGAAHSAAISSPRPASDLTLFPLRHTPTPLWACCTPPDSGAAKHQPANGCPEVRPWLGAPQRCRCLQRPQSACKAKICPRGSCRAPLCCLPAASPAAEPPPPCRTYPPLLQHNGTLRHPLDVRLDEDCGRGGRGHGVGVVRPASRSHGR